MPEHKIRSGNTYYYSFPAVKGIQAGRPFYTATCPLRLVPKIFNYDEEEVPAELRAQRTLNKARIPEMARYLVDYPNDYIFSAITASVSEDVEFSELESGSNLGTLHISMDASILINDGQHRRAAIEEAIRERPELCQENIAVLFFIDEGLKKSQQMFADLNKFAVRPSASISTLYDHRDQAAGLARNLALSQKPFVKFTELERPSVSVNSNKVFTLSAIKSANKALFGKGSKKGYSPEEEELAKKFWLKLYDFIPEWRLIHENEMSVRDFRRDFITAHGIGLQSLAMAGREILAKPESEQRALYNALKAIDWRKSNDQWRNRAMQHGRLSKAHSNILLTSIEIKRQIGLALSESELTKEKEFLKL